MKKRELHELYNKLQKITSYTGHKFNYAIAKNISILKSEATILEKEQSRITEIIKEYSEERIKLCIEHANKNEKGEPKIIVRNGVPEYDITDFKKFEAELDKLKKKHKKVIELHEKESKEFEKALDNDEVTIDFYQISLQDVPETITTEHMNIIFPLIKEA